MAGRNHLEELIMDDERLARCLRQATKLILHRNGYWIDLGAEMAWFVDTMKAMGASLNPHLYDELFDDPCEYLACLDKDGTLASIIAWREIRTSDYVADMRSGRAWIPEPDAMQFGNFDAIGADISGRILSRGALFTNPIHRGQGLAWAMTTLSWSAALERQPDYVVSITRAGITEKKLATRIFGYRHDLEMPKHLYPFFKTPEQLNLVYSSLDDIRHECSRRLRFLRQRHGYDMGAIAGAWEVYQQAQEGPLDVDRFSHDQRKVASA
jgi:hypothetical protein